MAQTVCVTRVIPQPGIDLLRRYFEVDVNESDQPYSEHVLREYAGRYDAFVTLLTDKIDSSILDAGRGKLKVVANVAVGFDNIDVDAATKHGTMVTNTPGVLTDTTADFVWALILAIGRRVVEADRYFRAGKFQGWSMMLLLGDDIHGSTLGIVGFGRIGQAVAKRATGFGMRILYFDPVIQADEVACRVGARKVELDTLLRESDFVTLHTPLAPETHHLISDPQLAMMKSTAYLVNTSRGPIVDEAALARALRNREIAGAALDVFEQEPKAKAELLDLENIILAPHIASASVATRTRMATMAAENVIVALGGQRPPALLNPDVLS